MNRSGESPRKLNTILFQRVHYYNCILQKSTQNSPLRIHVSYSIRTFSKKIKLSKELQEKYKIDKLIGFLLSERVTHVDAIRDPGKMISAVL